MKLPWSKSPEEKAAKEAQRKTEVATWKVWDDAASRLTESILLVKEGRRNLRNAVSAGTPIDVAFCEGDLGDAIFDQKEAEENYAAVKKFAASVSSKFPL